MPTQSNKQKGSRDCEVLAPFVFGVPPSRGPTHRLLGFRPAWWKRLGGSLTRGLSAPSSKRDNLTVPPSRGPTHRLLGFRPAWWKRLGGSLTRGLRTPSSKRDNLAVPPSRGPTHRLLGFRPAWWKRLGGSLTRGLRAPSSKRDNLAVPPSRGPMHRYSGLSNTSVAATPTPALIRHSATGASQPLGQCGVSPVWTRITTAASTTPQTA